MPNLQSANNESAIMQAAQQGVAHPQPFSESELQNNAESYRKCLVDMAVRLHSIPQGKRAAPEAVWMCNEAVKYELPEMQVTD